MVRLIFGLGAIVAAILAVMAGAYAYHSIRLGDWYMTPMFVMLAAASAFLVLMAVSGFRDREINK